MGEHETVERCVKETHRESMKKFEVTTKPEHAYWMGHCPGNPTCQHHWVHLNATVSEVRHFPTVLSSPSPTALHVPTNPPAVSPLLRA